MKNNYVSSIIKNYGDMQNVRNDSKTVGEIVSRQGSDFLLDVVAETAGNYAVEWKLSPEDRKVLIKHLTEHFINALNERL